MPTVAEQLRQGREAMKLDVHQVAESTKLKTDQIRALDKGDYDYFSATVYLRGSVRTYANLLKLDAAKLTAQLDEELATTKKFADEAIVPSRKKGGVDSIMLLLSRLNWGIAGTVIALALIALVAQASYRAFKNRKASDPLKNLGSGMYQPAETGGEILPLPTNAPRRAP
ncbi:MAG TPA: helix-turn-helix domain-containing protein [Candidatus Limnocylindria bacterium]|nr:helix-turn-helix domain-containing protein [Candidatus Limnocylindria bacterium]